MKIKQKLIIVGLLVFGLLVGCFSLPTTTQAAGIQILPELPANNIGGKTLGYFNLPVATTKTQTVRIKVTNPESRATAVTVRFENAVTLNGGQVDYTGIKTYNRQLLPRPVTKQLSAPKRVKLAAGQSKWLKIKIAPSTTKFKGRKAGAVVLTNAAKRTDVAVQNNYVYVIGITLNGKKLKSARFKQFKVTKVQPQVMKKKALLRTKLVNPDPMYLKKGNLKLTFQNEKWSLTNYTLHKKDIEVAPCSDFWVNTHLGGKRLVPGDYKLTIHFKNDQYTKKLVRRVHITKSQAYFINQNNREWQKRRHWLIGLAIAAVVLVIVVVVAIIIWRRKRSAEHGRPQHRRR